MSKRSIVVGIDGGAASEAAARWTADHLGQTADLVLAHAIYVPQPPSFLRGLYPPVDALFEDAQRGAQERLRELSDSLGARRVTTVIRAGRPADVLVQVAHECQAELLVVGPHVERHGIWRVLSGTAERVTRASAASTLLARDLPFDKPCRVLVALEESDLIAPILEWVARIAGSNAGDAIVLHVARPPLYTAVAASASELNKVEAKLRGASENWLRSTLAGSPLESAQVTVEFGDPGLEILAAQRRYGSDLLVIGAHGARPDAGKFMGSVVEFILRNQTGSVLVVAPKAGA